MNQWDNLKTIHDNYHGTYTVKECPECQELIKEVTNAGGWQQYYLQQATKCTYEALLAEDSKQWGTAYALLKLAYDYITDSGVIP